MARYELFRLSLIGWSPVAAFCFIVLPLAGALHVDLALVALATLLLTTPALGYVINQLVLGLFVAVGGRPHDRLPSLEALRASFLRAVADAPYAAVLEPLTAKDLHRLLWVSCAEPRLVDRSESYWERYYTNIGISIASTAGVVAAFVYLAGAGLLPVGTALRDDLHHGLSGGLVPLAARLLVLAGADIALLTLARRHCRIAMAIEESWIAAMVRLSPRQKRAALQRIALRVPSGV